MKYRYFYDEKSIKLDNSRAEGEKVKSVVPLI